MGCVRRTKRVTGPLDDKVKARIVGLDRGELVDASSGSEHGGEADDESPCLSDLVHGFLEDDAADQSPEKESDSEGDLSIFNAAKVTQDLMNLTIAGQVDSFKALIVAHVSRAMVAFASVKSNKPILRRRVMAYLRDCGYDSAICKTKWETSGGLTAGNYEFIDVVRSESASSQQRYYIDLDFAGEFEIARPTNQYEWMLQALPRVFVGRSEELKQIVKVMSDAAKRSLRSRGLHLPPWRKNRFMQNKWFGPYRRSVNITPSNSSSFTLPATQASPVKCRLVGFDAVTTHRLLPATTR